MNWEQVGVLVGVFSPLVGAPLVLITLYLRTIREQQTAGMAELTHRIQTMEQAMHELLRSSAEFEREYTTKEEWVRESMFALQRLDRLTELVTRIQAALENGQGLAGQLGRVADEIRQVVQHGSCLARYRDESLVGRGTPVGRPAQEVEVP